MEWDKSIERYSLALLRIVGALFAQLVAARLAGADLFLPRRVWRSILLVLRPAEAAVRRLVIIAARNFASPSCTFRQRAVSASQIIGNHLEHGSALDGGRRDKAFALAPVFHLFDPLKPARSMWEGGEGEAENFLPQSPDNDDSPVNADALFTRMRALRYALDDLPAQALRLARFNARRDMLLKAGRPVRISLMRPGAPPGFHRRGREEIDTVLLDCHRLAHHFLNTS